MSIVRASGHPKSSQRHGSTGNLWATAASADLFHSSFGGRRSAIIICRCNIPLCLFECRPSAIGGRQSAIGDRGSSLGIPKSRYAYFTYLLYFTYFTSGLWLVIGYRLSLLVARRSRPTPARSTLEEVGGYGGVPVKEITTRKGSMRRGSREGFPSR